MFCQHGCSGVLKIRTVESHTVNNGWKDAIISLRVKYGMPCMLMNGIFLYVLVFSVKGKHSTGPSWRCVVIFLHVACFLRSLLFINGEFDSWKPHYGEPQAHQSPMVPTLHGLHGKLCPILLIDFAYHEDCS